MIGTVTLNLALDVTYAVDELVVGGSHRVGDVRMRAGGKGVNVARYSPRRSATRCWCSVSSAESPVSRSPRSCSTPD